DELWAIKFLKPQSDLSEMDRARFVREMEITLNMQHNALIRCVDCGDENGQLFIVMDYCTGGNLHELLKRSGKLKVRRAVRLMDRLLAGVDFAHEKGIVHRDLKPSNILLHKDANDKYLPKISDFGLAKSYLQAGESGMTVNGAVGGSCAYLPKEQLTNFRFVSPQSDVWSLGAILYECLTLKLPRPMEKGSDPIRTILESKIVPLQELMPELHPEVIKFVMKCLAREPEQRYQDAGAMRTALKVMAEKASIEL
ncbi:MAG: serine/threonine-protein kinase, partial [Pirellula sp.]